MERLISRALFASVCAPGTHSGSHLQAVIERFSDASGPLGLTISPGKIEVLLQPSLNTASPKPALIIDNTQLENANNSKAVDSTISSDGSLDKEIRARIQSST